MPKTCIASTLEMLRRHEFATIRDDTIDECSWPLLCIRRLTLLSTLFVFARLRAILFIHVLMEGWGWIRGDDERVTMKIPLRASAHASIYLCIILSLCLLSLRDT